MDLARSDFAPGFARIAIREYESIAVPAMFAAFRSRNYALFWTGSLVSNVGTWVQTIALGWLVYEMTRSASSLGLISFAGYAPALIFGLLVGAVADRVNYKTVLVGSQLAAALTAFVLSLLTATGALRVWQIVALALASGMTMSLYMPVVQVMLPSLVPPRDLLNAVSLTSVSFNLARIIGPLIAGFAYSTIGPAGCFAVNGVSFLVLVVLFSRLRISRHATPSPSSIWAQLAEGIRYARSDGLIVAVLLLAAGVSLFAFPYIVLMPAIARDLLSLGPDGLGMMMGGVGTGAVVGGLGLASVGDVQRKALLAFISAAGLAICLVAFTFTRTLSTALPVLALLGIAQVTCVAALNTTLQVRVRDSMRGRVMSMLTLCFFGLSTLGSLLLGMVGDQIGVDRALCGGGLVILALATWLGVRSPGIADPVTGDVQYVVAPEV